jgi:phosphopantetheinyl transferase (holo-ACP synthase)
MPILSSIRRSPAYLYLKIYLFCTVVTLIQASPVSSQLPRIGQRLQLNKYRIVKTRLGPRIVPVGGVVTPRKGEKTADKPGKELIVSPELVGSWRKQIETGGMLKRWYQRVIDLAQVNKMLRDDENDMRMYPELGWDATVRRSSDLHEEEMKFIEIRKCRISSQGTNSLHRFLDLPHGEVVDPRDVPLIALGGSGGGYRAMYGFTAFISASQKLGLWDCITWTAGVSGSCWAIAGYYTIAYHKASRLMKHYLTMAEEHAHPMSVFALNTVARSSKGIYFLIGPLVRKVQSGIIGLGILDLYATLTTTYQLLSRETRARLSRATFQFSKVWTRSGIDRGSEPMPILTAVRRAPREFTGVKPHNDSSMSKGQPPKRALKQHQVMLSSVSGGIGIPATLSQDVGLRQSPGEANTRKYEDNSYDDAISRGTFQWFEISPLEIGSAEAQAYIPTWSWGRSFVSGHSIGRPPEQSLSLLLGHCTNAPAAPLTTYITALLASLPKGTIVSRILHLLNNFLRMKQWERLWGNPILAGHIPNPFYGLSGRPHLPLGRQIPKDRDIIGIGISILHSSRLDKLLSRRKRNRPLMHLARRILCKAELEELDNVLRRLDVPLIRQQKIRNRLTVTWTAKIAAHKALAPAHNVSWKDLVVSYQIDETTKNLHSPIIRFSTEWMDRNSGTTMPQLRLSTSRDGDSTVSSVLAEHDQGMSLLSRPRKKSGSPHIPISLQRQESTAMRVNLSSMADQSHSIHTQSKDHGDSLISLSSDEYLHSSGENQNTSTPPWEFQGRIRLMDSGMSNNLPSHVLARPERSADLILVFDASSDTQNGFGMKRLHNFADDCNIKLEEETELFELPSRRYTMSADDIKSAEVESKFLTQYTRVFRATREDTRWFYLVYCPLLPNADNPTFDPSVRVLSSSNLRYVSTS